MKQALTTEPGKIEFNQIHVEAPGSGQTLLRIDMGGSDVHVYHSLHAYSRSTPMKK